MKLKKIVIFLCVICALAACETDSDLPTPRSEPEPVPEMGARTVLAYIAADNTLSQFSLDDLNEMVEGVERVNTQDNNLLVYIDRSGAAPQLIRICRDIKNKIILDTLKSYAPRNSVGVNEMKEVFAYTFSHFPSDNYGLILWSHGDGWAPYPGINSRWVGQDGNKRMNIIDLHTVLQAAPHFDYLFFDACFMQAAEVAYELRHCADYFIGSPTEIPGPGAPYHKVVPFLFAKENVATGIASTYFDYYEEKYANGANISDDNWTGGVSISVIRSDALDGLAAATKQILPVYIKHQEQVKTVGIMYYDRQSGGKYYYDLDGLIRSLTVSSDYQEWKQAFDKAVIYWKTTEQNFSGIIQQMFPMQGATGISVYIPHSYTPALNAFYHDYQWYTAAGWEPTGW